MRTLVIEKSALKNNISVIKEAAGSACIYANLSRDAYGAGAVNTALFLREEGISRFAVDDAEVAAALREAGLVEEEILMLRSVSDKEELELLMEHNVICTIGNLEAGVALNALAAERATVAEAQIQVDCGMGFGGFPAEEPEKMAAIYQNLTSVAISGVYTQIHSGKNTEEQLAAFNAALEHLRTNGYETGVVHAAGSYALLHSEDARLEAVRAGSALLGRCRREKKDGLEVVGYGETTVAGIRWLPKGHTVGGRKLKTLRRPTKVAVIPVGYHNGFGVMPPVYSAWDALRRFFKSRKRTVELDGRKVKVLGSVGGMETLLDVTDVKCTEGDVIRFELDPQFARGFKREFR